MTLLSLSFVDRGQFAVCLIAVIAQDQIFPTIITNSLECIEVQASSFLLGTLHLCTKHLSPLMQKKKQGDTDPWSNPKVSIDLLLFFFSN